MPLIIDDSQMDTNMAHGMAGPVQVDHIDVDDLFGDGVALSLPNVRPPSKHLYQRLDELRTRGCCQ
jgi:mediator of RNA polymerase II transcription subunit 16